MWTNVGPAPTSAMKSLGGAPVQGVKVLHPAQGAPVDRQAKAKANQADEQHGEKAAGQDVVAAGPDKHRLGNEAAGLVGRHHDRAEDAGGEAHVVKHETVMGPEEPGGHGRRDEPHQHAGAKRQRNGLMQRHQ
ncbi:hypothetical protein ACERNI_02905 [Camelimonas sp. ID_303_24]